MDNDPTTLNNASDLLEIQIDPSLRSDPHSLFPLHDEKPDDPDNDHEHQPTQAELDEATASAITASLANPLPPTDPEQEFKINFDGHISGGDEGNPIISPAPNMAPFYRPDRNEHTPHPQCLQFSSRDEFDAWLAGESSWCHYVQRRSTTPEKRAEERLKAREKAYERIVAGMTEEEAAVTPPLKRRRRIRTSSIAEKITYTCHHAGKYSAKHSATLPQEKLRLNTKQSVKCDCTSRIVLNEMDTGLCKVVYYWRHERHDPFADNEHNTGRLPKVIDDWLIAQIKAGRDTESIRKLLQMSEEDKEDYLRRAAENPSSITPDMPPPLALSLKIKYPDIYNRYRKLKGPIKSTKVLKTRRAKIPLTTSHPLPIDDAESDFPGPSTLIEHQDHSQQHDTSDYQADLGSFDGTHHLPNLRINADGNVETVDGLPDGLAELASQGHEGLARALLSLPRGAQGDVEDMQLSEEVLRIAQDVAVGASGVQVGNVNGSTGVGGPGTGWDALGI